MVVIGLALASASWAVEISKKGLRQSACASVSKARPRDLARMDGCKEGVSYLGAYFSDGKFRKGQMESWWAQDRVNHADGILKTRPSEVPPEVNLMPLEHRAENLQGNATLHRSLHGQSAVAEFRDRVITFMYGHELEMVAPEYVTTNTRGWLIVSDPGANTVHVLDPEHPFRIVGGPSYRLANVGPVAADVENNIYVADPVNGVLEEFDEMGHFLREIGRLAPDEAIFHEPTALEVDRQRNELYVADAGREMILILDADGNVVRKVGGRRRELGVSLHRPTAMAIQNEQIVVLDSDGTRIQVFDMEFHLRRTIETHVVSREVMGLDMDRAGNIYISNSPPGRVRVFDAAGRFKGEFGIMGKSRGALEAPTGLHIEQGRLYIADKQNRRVDVYELVPPEHRM
jgi:DNA-binding beta-propeller fold protein YncE